MEPNFKDAILFDLDGTLWDATSNICESWNKAMINNHLMYRFTLNDIKSPFIEIMKKYNVQKCIYGHLHSLSINEAIQGNIDGIDTKLVSSDSLGFKLLKIK